MKTISGIFEKRIKSQAQVVAESADPRLIFTLSRPKTPLTNSHFLETQKVISKSGITKSDIAVSHPFYNRQDQEIYIAYIEDGAGLIKKAKWKAKMEKHLWQDVNFLEQADEIAICYDSNCIDKKIDKYEFLTKNEPWVFWVKDGVLTAQNLTTREKTVLASENATKVTAVRATHASVNIFNMGLIVFFVSAGKLFYRQLIDDEWCDAEAVNFGGDLTFKEISASRTWDYRIVFQGLTESGEIYELYSQYAGIGSRAHEHINIKHVKVKGINREINQVKTKTDEYVEIQKVEVEGKRLYAFTANPISAKNIDDGTGNFGRKIEIIFDHELHDIQAEYKNFILTDSNNINYVGEDIAISNDGLTLTVTMSDFNLAGLAESAEIIYTQGNIMSPVVPLESFKIPIVLTGLVPIQISMPEVETITNG